MASATDNFNRASLGSNWTASINSCSINASTDVKGNTAADNNAIWWNANTFDSDQSSQVEISNKASDGGPTSRNQAAGANFYFFDCDTATSSSNAGIYRCSSGSFTLLGAIFNSGANANGDAFKIVSTGSTHAAFIRGSSVTTRSDATFTGGSPGLVCFDTSIRWDNWVGDPISAADTLMGQICM